MILLVRIIGGKFCVPELPMYGPDISILRTDSHTIKIRTTRMSGSPSVKLNPLPTLKNDSWLLSHLRVHRVS